ncbi:MAG: ABC transporter substrate-binding protein [Deltaproteobacteria bacterium]|nr:ABC transporter substrate-binding protein [Deltaproteobacteria bacterium]
MSHQRERHGGREGTRNLARQCRAGLSLAVMALLLFAWGPAQAAEKVSLRLSFVPSGKDAIFFYTRELGLWQASGLQVEIGHTRGSLEVCQFVGLNKDEFGIAEATTVMQSRAKGMPIRMLGLQLPKTPVSLISKAKVAIRTPKDLEGKSIALSIQSSTAVLLPAFLRQNGVDATRVALKNTPPGSILPVVLADRAEAAGLYAVSFLPAFKAQGWEEGRNLNVLRFGDHGFERLLGVSIITSEKIVRERPDLVRRFLPPLFEAIRRAMRDPDAAAASLRKQQPELNISLPAIKEGLLESFRLMDTPEAREHTLGWIAPDKVHWTHDLLAELKMLERRLSAEELFTNEFLAGPPFQP